MTAAATTQQNHCRRCGRALRNTTPDGFKPNQIAAARELIEDGGIVPVRTAKVGTVYRTVATDGSETYLTTAAGHCTCPAGNRSARCYHIAAALSLAA